MKNIRQLEIEALISAIVKGTTMVTVETETNVDKEMSKDSPYRGIRKFQAFNGAIGYIYENALNRQATREGKETNLTAKPHPWGDMDEKHLFRINRKSGEKYLSVRFNRSLWVRYVMPNGEEIPNALVEVWLRDKSKSSSQATLDKEIIVRDFKMSSILAIQMMGETYVLRSENIPPCIMDNMPAFFQEVAALENA